MTKIEEMSFSKEKVKQMDFDHFTKVIDGYVKAGTLIKPTDSQIKQTWEKITGIKLEPEKKKLLTDK
jgi:hypothetical protein